jgi:hypothetical protein
MHIYRIMHIRKLASVYAHIPKYAHTKESLRIYAFIEGYFRKSAFTEVGFSICAYI